MQPLDSGTSVPTSLPEEPSTWQEHMWLHVLMLPSIMGLGLSWMLWLIKVLMVDLLVRIVTSLAAHAPDQSVKTEGLDGHLLTSDLYSHCLMWSLYC
jgi:hypothetical protein